MYDIFLGKEVLGKCLQARFERLRRSLGSWSGL
jgi:hypothetical protein